MARVQGKIVVPTFTDNIQTSTGVIILGQSGSEATVGNIRQHNTADYVYRNATNSANIFGILHDNTNGFFLGDGTLTPGIQIRASTNVQLVLGSTVRVDLSTARFEFSVNTEVSWARTVPAPQFMQQVAIAGTAQPLWIHAQSINLGLSSADGGRLRLSGGKPSVSGLKGGTTLDYNVDDTAAGLQPMVEVSEVISGNRVLALCRASLLTTTQMPANTGDKVVYLADAAVNPSANPVSGGILYSSGGALFWRGSGGSVTPIAPA